MRGGGARDKARTIGLGIRLEELGVGRGRGYYNLYIVHRIS